MEQASRCNFAGSGKNIDVDDRISKLPDVILSHILTFLNMKEAFGTRLLSHRWRYLCVPMSNIELDSAFILGFDYKQLPFDGEYVSRLSHVKWKFVERVDKFLNIVTVQKPQTLKVSFPLGREFASHIDDWISFAVRMECQQIELDFDHATCDFYGNYSEPYNFPCHLLPLCEKSPLKHLFLKDCIFKPPPELANILNCLKSLRLDGVPVEPSDLEIILSGCLNLEWLGLIDCRLLSTLRICGQNLRLKWLILSFCSVVEKIELSVPNLEMFEYEGWLPNFTFSTCHQLKKVVLLIHEMTQRGWKPMLDELAGNVPHLQTLSLTWRSDKSLSYAHLKDHTPMFYNLTHLELSIGGEYDWNLFRDLLYRSHQLEVFVIDKDFGPPNVGGEPSWTNPQPVPGCISSCLRKVCFRRFHGRHCELEFAKYILKNARVLETMTITISVSVSTAEEKLQIIRKIYAFPRSSETCQVLLNGVFPTNPSRVLIL